MRKKIIVTVLVLISLSSHLHSAEELRGISFFSPRSQDMNAARDVVGWHPFIHRYDAERNYAAISFTPQYNQSLRPKNISLALFNSDTFSLSGSQLPGRQGTNELLADYFGLSPAFASDAFFKPFIRNLILDMAVYIGFDRWVRGLYLQVRGPAVWTEWTLKLTETIIDEGENTPYPAGYMAASAIQPPYSSYKEAMRGLYPFGEVQPLKYGKICGAQRLSGFAAVEIVFGYDFICKERSHVGLNLRVSAPTGSRPNGIFFFEPRIGCGKNWRPGFGFTGHTRLWEKDGEQELIMWVDVNFTTILKSHQTRSFDLCKNGFFSRYILAKEFDATGMFTQNIVPTINFTTLQCNVHNSIVVDMVFMFSYMYNEFTFDIGYNGWIRSREKISLRECIPANTYGLKGVQFAVNPVTGQPNNSTESLATIYETGPIISDGLLPVFITTADINLHSAASPLLITQKLFWNLSYAWPQCTSIRCTPYLGIGAEIEFEGINTRNAYQPIETTMGQTSLWLKGGFAF
jgi:hypothetical protein